MIFPDKTDEELYSGGGVYLLTFFVKGGERRLCQLRKDRLDNGDVEAVAEETELGKEVAGILDSLKERYGRMFIVSKQVMPDHLHAVVWCLDGFSHNIKDIANDFSRACGMRAEEMDAAIHTEEEHAEKTHLSLSGNTHDICHGMAREADTQQAGYGSGSLFGKPQVRVLSYAGQLKDTKKYLQTNPKNEIQRMADPYMYVTVRKITFNGLSFHAMGKARILDYPDRYVVALSRKLTDGQIAEEAKKVTRIAQTGTVIYIAPINKGERTVAREVREQRLRMVVMMHDGFPRRGSDKERHFLPGGVYHRACAEGRLLVVAPCPENYEDERVVRKTDEELRRKSELKGFEYSPLPHSSARWRFVAGNMMLELINGEEMAEPEK